MNYVSKNIGLVIGDDNYHEFVDDVVIDGKKVGRGLVQRNLQKQPFGTLECATPFNIPTIPRSEWDERIKDMEAEKSTISDFCSAFKIPIKYQGQSNFCWAFASVHAQEIKAALENLQFEELSPSSVACPIKGWRNQGGLCTQSLAYQSQYGVVPSKYWPDVSFSRSYDTVENNARRAAHQVAEWWELQPGSFDQLMTCLLLGYPVAAAYYWWMHAVLAADPVCLDGRGQYGVRIRNSWGPKWADNGTSILTEDKATPDDAFAPRSVMAAAA